MMKDNVRGLQHIGLPVTDIVRSQAFYRALGFTVVMECTLPPADQPIQVAMLELGNLVLELYQLAAPDLENIRARPDGHIDHLALDVADIDRALHAVRSLGLEPLEEAPVFLPFWDKGVRYFNVRGPDGEKVEFNERVR